MTLTGCAPFDKWCGLHGEKPVPATPAAVAGFIRACAPHGIEKIWPLVTAISRAHYLIGLADPTVGGPACAALNEIAKIEPPRSWPKEYKFRFTSLPYDLQIYMAAHEVQRDKEVRRAQSEAAALKQKLAAISQPAKAQNGNQSNAA